MDGPRILLVAGDEDGGCGHYRMREPARAAKLAGIDIDVVTSLETESTMTGNELTIGTLDTTGADLVVFQRPVLHVFVKVIEYLQLRGVACAVELDDDIMAVHKHNTAFDAFNPETSPHSNWRHLQRACAMADLVITSTPSLAERYAPHGRSVVIRNRLGAADLNPDKVYADKLRLGWSGTVQTHPEDLDVTGPHVRAAMDNAGLTSFHVVGDGFAVGPKLGLSDRYNIIPTGWVPRPDYIKTMGKTFDVGIVPLKLDTFNAGKSWLKLLEMSSQGIPAVASPTPENLVLAEITGTPIAHKQKDWQKHLNRLLGDRDYALEMGAAARDAVTGLTYENAVGEWADAWMLAIEERAKHRVVVNGAQILGL